MALLPDGSVKETSRREVARIRDGLSPGTARNFLSVASRLFSFAIERGYVEYNPTLSISKPASTKHKRWPADVLEWFEKNVTSAAIDIYHLAIITGQRASDIVRMRNKDIVDGVLHLITQKTGAHVYIPMEPFKEVHLTAKQASDLFRYELKRLGLKGYALHGLRHTFAARKAEQGASSEEIAAMLGHSTIQMAHEYVRDAERRKLALNGFRR